MPIPVSPQWFSCRGRFQPWQAVWLSSSSCVHAGQNCWPSPQSSPLFLVFLDKNEDALKSAAKTGITTTMKYYYRTVTWLRRSKVSEEWKCPRNRQPPREWLGKFNIILLYHINISLLLSFYFYRPRKHKKRATSENFSERISLCTRVRDLPGRGLRRGKRSAKRNNNATTASNING